MKSYMYLALTVLSINISATQAEEYLRARLKEIEFFINKEEVRRALTVTSVGAAVGLLTGSAYALTKSIVPQSDFACFTTGILTYAGAAPVGGAIIEKKRTTIENFTYFGGVVAGLYTVAALGGLFKN